MRKAYRATIPNRWGMRDDPAIFFGETASQARYQAWLSARENLSREIRLVDIRMTREPTVDGMSQIEAAVHLMPNRP